LGLGDLLTAVPALRALRDALPRHRIVLATTASLFPLVPLIEAVDAVWAAAPHVPLALPAPPDIAVDLHGRGPRSQRVLLGERPARLVGFAHPDVPETTGLAEWRDDEHEVARWCRMLAGAGIPADPSRIDLAAPAVEPPPGCAGATLIHPGAASPARRWPAERFAAVGRAETAAGRRVVVTAGPGEEALAQAVAARSGPGAATLASPSLPALASAVAAAGRVVCGDTGIAHLATALRTPSVVLFGPVSPASWGPPADRPRHRALWAGRRGDPHGSRVDAGLLAIGVDEVLSALDEVASRDAWEPSGSATAGPRRTSGSLRAAPR
jgi:ADP-heptose:LPS heptosyltransferase